MSIASLASGPVTNIILFYFMGDNWGMKQMTGRSFRLILLPSAAVYFTKCTCVYFVLVFVTVMMIAVQINGVLCNFIFSVCPCCV